MPRTVLKPAPFLTALMFAASLGCGSSPVSELFTPVYDACFTVNDCVETATLCEELSVEFGGFDYINSICTLTCAAEGSVSTDCPRAYVGLFGSCYPSSVAGGLGLFRTLLRRRGLSARFPLPRSDRPLWSRSRPVPHRRKRRNLRTGARVTLLKLRRQARANPFA